MQHLQDSFGRKFPYIRMSITDVCNFKCGYCLPNGYQVDKSDNRKFLHLDEIKRLAKCFSELGVYKIRITGGEPTVRKDFFEIIKVLKIESGIKKVVITTLFIPDSNFKNLIISKKSFLTVGSPPVILILQTPSSEKHFARRLISSK